VWASENIWNFEDGILGVAENKTNSKITTNLVESDTKEGKYSVEISNSTDGSAGFQISVNKIEGGKKYQAGSWMKTEEKVKQGFIRIAWYESEDGSGSQMNTVDSEKLKGNQDWTWLTASQLAPENAKSAKIRVMISSESDGVNATAKVDEIKWTQVAEQPTYTPAPPRPTPTPTTKLEPTEKEQIDEEMENDNVKLISEEKETEGKVLAKKTEDVNEIEENSNTTPERPVASDSGITRTRKIYKFEEAQEATGSFSLLKPPGDGWLAIGVGCVFIIVGAASYAKSYLNGEYNRKNEN